MLHMTEAAVAKVNDYLQDDENKGKALRVFVEGGGCSGFQYGLAFDDQVEDDTVLEFGPVKVVVDPASAEYIKGASIDFIDGLQGSGFKVTNPNAKSTCGCGSSFEA
jgi:iron-sulfur cluster insertion protein